MRDVSRRVVSRRIVSTRIDDVSVADGVVVDGVVVVGGFSRDSGRGEQDTIAAALSRSRVRANMTISSKRKEGAAPGARPPDRAFIPGISPSGHKAIEQQHQ
jgi:hypothetical protein